MRAIVTAPMVKGEMSTRLTAVLDEPYLRFCRPCDADPHLRAAVPAGRAAGRAGAGARHLAARAAPGSRTRAGAEVPERLDVVRAYLRLLGPATPQHVAGYLDAPVKDVKARWPADAVEVTVDGERRWLLADDADRLDEAPAEATLLLGPFDLFLQARDRSLVVPDPARPRSCGARSAARARCCRRRGRRHLAGAEGRVRRHRLRRALGAGGPGRLAEQAERLAAFRGWRCRRRGQRLTAPARVDLRCAADSLDG